MADIGTLNPEQMLQQQQILRQQKLSEMLMQQPAPQGQMISGHYVAPSITQNLAGLANMYFGQRGIEKAEKAQLDLAKAIRAQNTDELNQFNQLLPKNPMEAYSFAAQANDPKLREIGFKKMLPQEFDLSEGQKRYMTMPDGTVKEIASGGQKFRAPLQIDTGTAIELRDPNNPTVVLQRISKSMSPADAARLADEGIIVGGGRSNAPAVNPVPMNNVPAGTSPIIKQNAPQASIASNAPAYAQNAVTMQPVNANNLLVPPQVNMAGVSPKEQRKIAGTQAEELQKNVKNSYEAYPVIKEIQQILPNATAGYFDQAYKQANRAFGKSTSSSPIDTQLEILGTKLVMLQPRFEGPQGVRDVELYQKAAGDIANASLPIADRMAGLEQVKNIYKRYAPNLDWTFAPTPVAVPKTNAPQASVPAGVDPAVWAVMTPAEKSLWK
jgi:hypothetical protein